MEAGLLLLLSALLGTAAALSFYGDSISFMPLQKKSDGTFQVTFYHRQNSRGSCQTQSSFTCDSGVCNSFNSSSIQHGDQDNTGQGQWCQSEGYATAIISKNKTSFSLRGSGCCWVSNINGKRNWTTHAVLDLGTRSDSHTLNSCPVTTTVSYLRVPQNCFKRISLLTHDPDGDNVRCRFSSDASVPSNFTLNETLCMLTSTGQVDIGTQIFEVILEDFPITNITLTYADGTSASREVSDPNLPSLCKVKVQFSVEILPPILSCEVGGMQPIFLSKTPSHGDVLHATVGQTFQFYAQAQAQHARINDFQINGPQNMSKLFKEGESGKAEVTVSWTPQQSDLYRFIPVCFTAETNKTQSEMRCIVVMVTQASIIQGKATVECSPNMMKVALDKASMPGLNENFLKLIDPSCSLTSNNTHIMGSMSFSTCGTKVEDKGDFIIFKNKINSFELPSEVITRRREVQIEFSCQFPKAITVSSYYSLHKSDYIFTESSFGTFGYTFEIFHDGNFTNKVDARAYPVEVQLLQKVFMGIEAKSELPNVKLYVESCKATPDDNPENSLSYDLIKNGCLKDETVKVHPSGQNSFNFEIQAFKFTGPLLNQVYITCSVILCEPDNPFSRCAQGCLENPSRRRRRGLGMETVDHYITQGPLQFVRSAVPNDANKDDSVMEKTDKGPVSPPPVSRDTESKSEEHWNTKQILNTNISTVVFACIFVGSVVFMGLIVFYFSKKRKEEDRNALIHSGWEQ
ncbi:uncharacterized protein LOC115041120 [Echeneis naucrates]|uniref:Uncharacterized LOC115041120 n=1 Tax=Echeneis naucrates TaxID=173247 RepID=A0A665TXI5_ECHNA|nr:uncharacterized protein LOC115041120 [Echeneis naucrates]